MAPSRKHHRLLIIDPEASTRNILEDFFSKEGYLVSADHDIEHVIDKASSLEPAAIVLDLLPDQSGEVETLIALKQSHPSIPVILITAYPSLNKAVEAIRLGAYEFIPKPFDVHYLGQVIRRSVEGRHLIDENIYLREEIHSQFGFDNIIGQNRAVQEAYVLAAKVARTPATILIQGESGTGKEFLAKSIHYQSDRSNQPFVKVSCAALPETLLESELFGYEKGAFTGATTRKLGRFELAHRGSLFLDEIGEISPVIQVKLLRVLQEKEFERVGGTETIRVDARILAATNRDLREAMRKNSFREDLYYRLNVVPISLPPLRERREDIPLLARYFVEKYAASSRTKVVDLSAEVLDRLSQYSWPGNVRELENCIERAVILSNDLLLREEHLLIPEPLPSVSAATSPSPGMPPSTLDEAKRHHLSRMLDKHLWNISRTAKALQVDRKTLRNQMRRYGLRED